MIIKKLGLSLNIDFFLLIRLLMATNINVDSLIETPQYHKDILYNIVWDKLVNLPAVVCDLNDISSCDYKKYLNERKKDKIPVMYFTQKPNDSWYYYFHLFIVALQEFKILKILLENQYMNTRKYIEELKKQIFFKFQFAWHMYFHFIKYTYIS